MTNGKIKANIKEHIRDAQNEFTASNLSHKRKQTEHSISEKYHSLFVHYTRPELNLDGSVSHVGRDSIAHC